MKQWRVKQQGEYRKEELLGVYGEEQQGREGVGVMWKRDRVREWRVDRRKGEGLRDCCRRLSWNE